MCSRSRCTVRVSRFVQPCTFVWCEERGAWVSYQTSHESEEQLRDTEDYRSSLRFNCDTAVGSFLFLYILLLKPVQLYLLCYCCITRSWISMLERKHSDILIEGVPKVPKGKRSNISVTIEGEVAQLREYYWCYNKAVSYRRLCQNQCVFLRHFLF